MTTLCAHADEFKQENKRHVDTLAGNSRKASLCSVPWCGLYQALVLSLKVAKLRLLVHPVVTRLEPIPINGIHEMLMM